MVYLCLCVLHRLKWAIQKEKFLSVATLYQVPLPVPRSAHHLNKPGAYSNESLVYIVLCQSAQMSLRCKYVVIPCLFQRFKKSIFMMPSLCQMLNKARMEKGKKKKKKKVVIIIMKGGGNCL